LQCVIYKSLRKQDTYLFVSREDGLSAVPTPLRQTLGKLEKVMELELTPGKRLARGEARHVIDDILEKGFHLQLPAIHTDAGTDSA